ncbi:LexA family transcriptional regulator [Acidovorax sp. LjRoot74]|uniref:LexA family transcriptional regulator n=1 Tax=Acidovorax sp. LjRoot74 TaxID=3342337 RepID=UPI003ED09909
MSEREPSRKAIVTEAHKAEAAALKAIWDRVKPSSQKEFGAEFGIGGQSAVANFLSGKSALSIKAAVGFAQGLGCQVGEFSTRIAEQIARMSWISEEDGLRSFTTGESKPVFSNRLPAHISAPPHEAPSEDSGSPPDLVITEFDTGGGMDTTGRLLLDDQPGIIKSWRVSHDWLRLNVPSHTGIRNLCIVTGFGPSMRPMFNPGDPLLVDTGVKTVTHEGVYFFRVGEEGYIKMIQRVPDPHGDGVMLNIISKNPDYPPYPMSPKNPHFEVLGKVLTVWRSEQY